MALNINTLIAAVKAQVGKPYVWGAEGPNSFDCSGLMQWAYAKAGMSIPRTSQEQARWGKSVSLAFLQPGDLITSNWGSGPSSHVGMYLGGGQIIHAPRPGTTVRIQALDANYRSHVNTVRRAPGASTSSEVGEFVDEAKDIAEGFLGTGGLVGALGDIGKSVSGMASSLSSVGQFAQLLMKLALPTTWVRIVSGFWGAVCIILGLFFLIREVRT